MRGVCDSVIPYHSKHDVKHIIECHDLKQPGIVYEYIPNAHIFIYIHLFATSPKSNLQILPQQQRVQNLEHVCACFRSVKKFTRNTRTNPSQYLSGTNVIRTEGIFEHADGRCSFDMRLYVTVKDGVDTKKRLFNVTSPHLTQSTRFLIETCMPHALMGL